MSVDRVLLSVPLAPVFEACSAASSGDPQSDEGVPEVGKNAAEERQRVRLWFGQRLMINQIVSAATAAEFAQATQRRCTGLPITLERTAEPSLPMVAKGDQRPTLVVL
jgi:hypothetical protein